MTGALAMKRVELLAGRDERARRVWLLDAVLSDLAGDETRVLLFAHHSKAEAVGAALELQCVGYKVDWRGETCGARNA